MNNTDEASYEAHVAANNQRLTSIGEGLSIPSSFISGCKELLQWTSDQRAFCPSFENNLLTVLQSVVENGNREGFEHSLSVQLIAQCHSFRKHLSKPGSARINRWHEQFRRQKRNAKKKKKAEEEKSAEMMTALTEDGGESVQNEESISVSCLIASSTTMMWQGGPHPGPSPVNSPNYPTMPQQHPGYAMNFQQSQMGGRPLPSGYSIDPSTGRPVYPGMQPNQMYDQNAAMFYNGAVQQQQQQQMMMQQDAVMRQQHYQRMMRARAMSAQHNGMNGVQQGMVAPPQYDASAFPQGVPMATNQLPGQMRPMVAYPNGQQGMGGGPMQHPNLPSPSFPGGSGTQMIRAGPPMLYGQMQQGSGQQQVMSYPNPNIPPDPVTLPSQTYMTVPKEVLLRPFQLEHGKTLCTQSFTLSSEMYNMLSMGDIDVQLKCFHREDKLSQTMWPQITNTQEMSLKVSLNGVPLQIRHFRQSLFLKPYLQLGNNNVEFTVANCVCSHFLIIQLVCRQPLPTILQEILARNKANNCSIESHKEKLKRLAGMQPSGTVVLPLIDGHSKRKMTIPARSTKCQHASCFDLDAFLSQYQDNSLYACPMEKCGSIFSISEIEVDHFLGHVLREKPGKNCTEVTIDASGEWNVIEMESRKREHSDTQGPAGSLKRIKSEPFGNAFRESRGSPMGPTSVPLQLAPSPASLMSPFQVHAQNSPAKVSAASPSAARCLGGPCTPCTPSMPCGNPSSVGLTQSISPHQIHQQSHGSVETASIAGSAPYTPASVSSSSVGHSTTMDSVPFNNIHNTSNSSVDFDSLDGLLTTTVLTSEADIRRYLADTSISMADDIKKEHVQDANLEELFQDVAQIIYADAR